MRTKIFVALLGMGILAVGCVKTVNDRHTAAVPWVNDKFEGKYERTVPQVYDASVYVVKTMGTVERESIISPGTNEVKTIEGKINDRNVWVRVEPVDSKITSVVVQVRTSAGGSDKPLTHEIEKQIAIKLSE
jgi:hypothetical protein